MTQRGELVPPACKYCGEEIKGGRIHAKIIEKNSVEVEKSALLSPKEVFEIVEDLINESDLKVK